MGANQQPINILSFGGGVQTVALASMACCGDLEMPDVAIFADPQWESKATYEYMDWFEKWMLERGLKLIRTTIGSLKEDSLSTKKRFASLPVYTEPNGMLMRQCTNEYKVQPVIQAIRRFVGLKRKERSKTHVKLWLGISLDEAIRKHKVSVKNKVYLHRYENLLLI